MTSTEYQLLYKKKEVCLELVHPKGKCLLLSSGHIECLWVQETDNKRILDKDLVFSKFYLIPHPQKGTYYPKNTVHLQKIEELKVVLYLLDFVRLLDNFIDEQDLLGKLENLFKSRAKQATTDQDVRVITLRGIKRKFTKRKLA